MPQSLAHIALVVRDYDEAIAFRGTAGRAGLVSLTRRWHCGAMTDDNRRTAILNGYRVTPEYLARFMQSQQEPCYRIAGEDYQRIRYGEEDGGTLDASNLCHDCRASAGQHHTIGCDMEECPRCSGQAIMCDCEDDEDDEEEE